MIINRDKLNKKIKIKSNNKSSYYVRMTLLTLLIMTIYAFFHFDYKSLNIFEALCKTFMNFATMITNPRASHFTYLVAIRSLLTTISLAIITTIIGSLISLFLSLFAAGNLSCNKISKIVKRFAVIIRAIPTIIWVLIFAISAGLGSEAAILGMSFHTIGYLVKAYSEVIEQIDKGVLEALNASGADWWHIVFQAVLPASMTGIGAWTFMRFEINFANAVVMGAAAGAGGIGFELFMASNIYFNVSEVGLITLLILTVAIIIEYISTHIKTKYLT